MTAGTLSVTNNSKAVVGVGTTFTAFKAGDFLSLVVGQVPYTIAISSIESDTALTLVLPFDGPTATGLAWDGIKRDTMSLATMGVTVQAQKALRLMIADENNWRAIFGDAEEITVTLPNGQVMHGMSWGYLSQLMKQIDPVEMRNLQQQAAASEAAAQGFRNEAEGFKTETAGIRDATNQIKTDTQAIHDATNTIKTQTNQIKADTQAIKDQTNQIKTDTGAIRDQANTAKIDAQAARDAAMGYRNEAEQFKNEVDPTKFLAKANNLNDLNDKAAARVNLSLDRLSQGGSATYIYSADKNKTIQIGDNGDWGSYDQQNSRWNALAVGRGGTGATTAEQARFNLETFREVTTSLTGVENLNNYGGFAAGVYRNPANANATTENNYPINQAGSLRVYRTIGVPTDPYAIQEYHTYQYNRHYSRVRDETGWHDWSQYTMTALSDERRKDVRGVLNVEGALDNINRMEFKIFSFKSDGPEKSYRRGVISQQIRLIDREYVREIGGLYHLDQTPMLLDGLAAIKALRARDEANKAAIADLRAEIAELKAAVAALIK